MRNTLLKTVAFAAAALTTLDARAQSTATESDVGHRIAVGVTAGSDGAGADLQ